MAEIMDCLVNYFSTDQTEDGLPRRYYSYHLVAGPGPDPESGVATITTLAVHSPDERCTYCENFHVARTGGPEAAIGRAARYLDALHEQDRLRKVQTEIRCSRCE